MSSDKDINIDELKKNINPFEEFGIDPTNYDYEKMKKQIKEVATKLKDINPKIQNAYEKIGEEFISSEEKFTEIRNHFISKETLKELMKNKKSKLSFIGIGKTISIIILNIFVIIGAINKKRNYNFVNKKETKVY